MKRLTLIGLFVVCLVGCQGSGTDGAITARDGLDFLERGNAVGAFIYTHGGSPLSIGSKQVFFAGPENSSASFNGTIDFGKVSGTDLLTPEDPTE